MRLFPRNASLRSLFPASSALGSAAIGTSSISLSLSLSFSLLLSFSFSFSFLLSCSSRLPAEAETNPKTQKLSAYFDALTELDKFNGVVFATENDSSILKQAWNLEDISHTSFITTDHQFDIHSVSKLMARYLIAKLEVERRLSANDAIEKYFPGFINGDKITIQMLLDHRSGLPRELMNLEVDEYDLEPKDIVALASISELLFEPGSDVQYSNVGYEVVYAVIAQLYGKSFAQCLFDEVFVPLGMNHSGSHFYTSGEAAGKPALNHVLGDSSLVRVDNILNDEFKTARVFSTAEDLLLFLKAIQQEPYASKLKSKEKNIIAKDGGSKGVRAQVYTDLERNFSFIILANYDEMPFFDVIEDVVTIMEGGEVELPKAINRVAIEMPNDELAKFSGTYRFPDFDGLLLSIEVDNGNLALFQDGERIATLKPESPTVFFDDPKAPESFEFVSNDTGNFEVLMGWKGIAVPGERVE